MIWVFSAFFPHATSRTDKPHRDVKHLKTQQNQPDETLLQLEYPASEYDENGNRKQMVRSVFPSSDPKFGNGSSVAYAYDLTSQLRLEDYRQAGVQNPFLSRASSYDNAGNRSLLELTTSNGVRSLNGGYDAANQLTRLELQDTAQQGLKQAMDFTHDKRGNRTGISVTPDSGQGGVVPPVNQATSLSSFLGLVCWLNDASYCWGVW